MFISTPECLSKRATDGFRTWLQMIEMSRIFRWLSSTLWLKPPTKRLNFPAASGCEISRAVHRWVSMAHIVVASEIFDGREGIVLQCGTVELWNCGTVEQWNCGTGHKSSFFQPPFVMRITAPQAWILFAGLKNMSLIFHGKQLTQFWCSDSSRF